MKQSLGLLEVNGLALAIHCADAMAKAASITLVGVEKTNGSGWMVITLTGDVASVQSAILTGAALAEHQHGLVAQKVIARPGTGIFPDTRADALVAEQQVAADTSPEMASVSCNLCLDPACERQKGEPRALCLHAR